MKIPRWRWQWGQVDKTGDYVYRSRPTRRAFVWHANNTCNRTRFCMICWCRCEETCKKILLMSDNDWGKDTFPCGTMAFQNIPVGAVRTFEIFKHGTITPIFGGDFSFGITDLNQKERAELMFQTSNEMHDLIRNLP